jgi:hypothetical protein
MGSYSDISDRRHRHHHNQTVAHRDDDTYEIQPYPRHQNHHHHHHSKHHRRSGSKDRSYACGGVFHAIGFEVYELWDAFLYGLGGIMHKMRI